MPGGNLTLKQPPPDLESYLARKRYPLTKWITANNITSLEALKNSNQWIISPELEQSISELLKPILVAIEPVVEITPISISAAIGTVESTVETLPTIATKEVILQPIFVAEEPIIPIVEEPTVSSEIVSFDSFTVEENISPQVFKERKKTR